MAMTILIIILFLLMALSLWQWWRQARVDQATRAVRAMPDTISLFRAAGSQWRNPEVAEWLAAPLRAKGFADLGIFQVMPWPEARLGVLVNEGENVAAFIFEHPKALLGPSLELNVRYTDGTSTQLVNRADNGVPPPPFFRVIFAEPDTRSGELYERLLRERSPRDIKPVTAETVIPEYEAAWARVMRWEKTHRLTADQVDKIEASKR